MEAIACALEIGAFPKNTTFIEKILDELKSFQNANGSFRNFGNYPESTSECFQTAYALIPFIKMTNLNFLTKSYHDVIENGFSFIRSRFCAVNNKESKYIVNLATAYYDKTNYLKFYDSERKSYFHKHYDILNNLEKCDLTFTSYNAIYLLTVNRYYDAMALMPCIFEQYALFKNNKTSHSIAIAAEAISKFLIARPVYLPTNLKITIENEHNFKNIINITDENQNKITGIDFPKGSKKFKVVIEGTGLLLVNEISEKKITIPMDYKSYFKLDLKTFNGSNDYEKTIQICTTIQSKYNVTKNFTIVNAMSDIEFPPGYVYKKLEKEKFTSLNSNVRVSNHYALKDFIL